MKKLVLVATLVVFGFSNLAAQEEDSMFNFANSDIFLEGNLGYSSLNDKNTEEKSSQFNFNPKVGYFLSEDFAIGVQLGLGSSKLTDDLADTEVTNSRFNAGVFGRYYFLDLGKRFKTFTELGLNYNSTKNEIDGVDDDFKTNGFGAGVGLGINYFVKENIAITFGLSDVLSYRTNKVDAEGAESVSQLNANVNVFNNFFETAQFGLLFKL